MRSLLVLSLFVAWPATAAELVLSGRIERVVAAGGLVAAIRGDEVRVLAEDGRSLLRLRVGPDEDTPHRRALEDEVEEVLERNGIADEDRDSDHAEALIEDESSLRQRRAARGQGLPQVGEQPVVAGSEHGLWIASGHTLWRVDASERAHPVTTLEERVQHLAAAPDGRLVAAAGARLLESRDGGVTFQRLAEASGPVRALAAGEARVAWLAAGELTWLEDGRATTLPFEQAAELRACGQSLLALGPRGLLVVAPERTTTLAAEAWRLGCAGRTWVVVGQRLLVSTDEGRTFSARFDLPPAVALDADVGQRFLWVGTAAGLFRLGDDQSAPAAPALAAVAGRRDRAAWAPFLPRLTIATSALLAPGRRDLRAVAYADFPLGAAGAPAPPPPRLVQVEPAAPPAAWSAPLPPDREASCLPLVRAQAVARALVEPERARSYVARAAHAAWLPEVRALYARRLGRSESLDLPAGGGVDEGPLGLDTANDVRWEARAIWDLSKLVFSTEEIAAVTTALRMADMRREVESLANRLYFERRRLKLEPVAATEPRGRRELRIQELEAELDALSGGAFTRCLPAPP
jgi:hypothetical protein